ncbi:MAG TPA: glycoside hydrolase, partial [Candidatus Eisenbacteria bacterium]|nr:glycoside hydrolase [Candidatus Eisenbacteria bacterium]
MPSTLRAPLARPAALALVAACALAAVSAARAQVYDPHLLAGLHWRLIGPFRGGRTVAASGVPGHPGLFYIGVNNGGVWKSTDYGRVWTPIFDGQPTGSIGALAVAPSDPNVIYVGSGEGLQRPDLSVGDGIYKSTDAGRTWTHLGLRAGQQIPALLVDPHDPRRVFAAVLGHPYGPNAERGVFRSLDGGATWRKVLYQDENTGAVDLAFDPANPRTVYAVLWAARQPPWEGSGGSFTLPARNGLYKSTDGGDTWQRCGDGLPGAEGGLGRIGIAVAPSEPQRLYAVLGATKGGGLYRSDDGGAHWRLANADHRLWDRDGDFNEVKVDPRNPDVVYVANVVTWKSTDGGRTFAAWRGAPGGDDYHRLWISPDDPAVILLAGDQGAVVTVNGGATWSSWYNQPTAQFYHVSTDNGFPYRVYGGQQESGSAAVLSRGDDGAITFRDWHPVGAEEYGYVAPDPLHPNLVFGGKLERWDWNTHEVRNVSPEPVRAGRYRWVRTMPVLFSPVDPHVLYLAANVLFASADGGQSWRTLSPDLTRAAYPVPPSLGAFTPLDPEHGRHRGVIYTIAPSFTRANLIWVGTDDGLIHVTHDGGATWRNVTPAALTAWSKVSLMEASHFDTLEAYAAVNRLRLDDLRPHVHRTRDGGRTWTEIVAGLPADAVVNAVREDPVTRGLLYAGTERGVCVSFDDGEHWQSLQLDLPVSAVRDLVVHDDDLVVGTHGRGFWILDDVTPLRQIAAAAAANAYLYRPETAVRVRGNTNTDTPLPPDEPVGENPPDGAILDFHLAHAARGPVTLEVLDAAGALVRRYSSADPPDSVQRDLNIPEYWIRPPQPLPAAAGTHRFVWDLRYAPPAALRHDYPIAAVFHDTPREPRG